MGLRRVRIDYTVYAPDYEPGEGCWDFRTCTKAKRKAQALGVGARVYRNLNEENKSMSFIGDWWTYKDYWAWGVSGFVTGRRGGLENYVSQNQTLD